MHHNAKGGIDMRNHSLEEQVEFLRVMQQMRKKMGLVWDDFFEKNPDQKEEDIRRRLEERMRSKQI